MKPKTTLLLGLILLVLAGAATVVQTSTKKARANKGASLFPSFHAEQSDQIEIHTRTRDINLKKAGPLWTVQNEEGKTADQKLVKGILDKIAEFRTSDVVSTSTERHGVFGVDSTGIRVQVSTAGKPTANFIVGKNGPDFMSSYVRAEGKKEVYRVPVYLPSDLDRGDETWRNQTVFDTETENITGWTTRNSKETVSVEKEADGTWKITEPEPGAARPDIVKVVLSSLSKIRSNAFADSVSDPARVGLEPDTMSVEIRLKDGSSKKIVIGTATATNQSYTKLADDPTIYLVPKGRWNTIFRPLETLKAENAPADAPTFELPGTK